MDASNPIDPLFLALAQPVLRGPEGQAVIMTPGTGGAAIGAQLWGLLDIFLKAGISLHNIPTF